MITGKVIALIAAVVIMLLYYFLIVRKSAYKQRDYVRSLKIGDEVLYEGRKSKIIRRSDSGQWIIETEAHPMGFDSKHNLNWR
jgi:preprotein translocase subunit YajC